jgi:hypothetical protein
MESLRGVNPAAVLCGVAFGGTQFWYRISSARSSTF